MLAANLPFLPRLLRLPVALSMDLLLTASMSFGVMSPMALFKRTSF